jgi:hypothetical protein
MNHHATTHDMPKIVPTTLEKLRIICDRENISGTETSGPMFGIAASTLRGYFNGARNPSKFARLHIERLVAAYERGGLPEMQKIARDAQD